MINKQKLLKDLRNNRVPDETYRYLWVEEFDYLIQLVELDIIREQEKKDNGRSK
jgi:hypothetical protein